MWFVVAMLSVVSGTNPVRADTYSYFYFSLEWLVDASDSIVEATVVPGPYLGNPNLSKIRIKTLHRVLKDACSKGPAEGTELSCHVPGGQEHRLLLFTRPDAKLARARVSYCVFLTEDPTLKLKKTDPFTRLPWHTSSNESVPFRNPTCVAIDQNQRVLTDPKAVVGVIEARIAIDPKRVTLEGRNIKCGPKVDDGDDHNLMVPLDPKAKQ